MASLVRCFRGPRVPGLAARVLGDHEQADYRALASHLGPLLGLAHQEKLARGITARELEALADDPLAALCQLCAALYQPLLDLTAALHRAAGPLRRGAVSLPELQAALQAAFGEGVAGPADLAEVSALFARTVRGAPEVDVSRLLGAVTVAADRAAREAQESEFLIAGLSLTQAQSQRQEDLESDRELKLSLEAHDQQFSSDSDQDSDY